MAKKRRLGSDNPVLKKLGFKGMLAACQGKEINAAGGKQSKIVEKPGLVPPIAILRVSKVLAKGASSYGRDNWRKICKNDHLDHALRHVYLHLAGEVDEDHLANASCRLLFAMETK